ncbi:hypothetical protein [Microbacterium sp. 22296]|uniref:hypothetical protein n=1 Tax=Microbacterium sp. 22296 TaxID=3453903 RepID=UPI003F85FD5A
MIATWGDVTAFATLCEIANLTVPSTIVKAQRLREVAIAHTVEPPAAFMGMSDDELRMWIDQVTIRRLSSGFEQAIAPFEAFLLIEVQRSIGPELEALVQEMQPRFDQVAAPFVDAVTTYGFTARTTSDDVIRMADDKASAAWRGTETFFRDAQAIAAVRQQISRVFDVSPTADEQGVYNGEGIDYSVCFAAGDSWTDDGRFYLAGRTGGTLDWFALASGGLRLNSPSEVARKVRARILSSSEGA